MCGYETQVPKASQTSRTAVAVEWSSGVLKTSFPPTPLLWLGALGVQGRYCATAPLKLTHVVALPRSCSASTIGCSAFVGRPVAMMTWMPPSWTRRRVLAVRVLSSPASLSVVPSRSRATARNARSHCCVVATGGFAQAQAERHSDEADCC